MLYVFMLFSVITLVAGIFTLLFPKKKINRFFGFRTKVSMSNQRSWDYANKSFSKSLITMCSIFTVAGIILIICSNYMSRELSDLLSLLLLIIESACFILPIFIINKKLKNLHE